MKKNSKKSYKRLKYNNKSKKYKIEQDSNYFPKYIFLIVLIIIIYFIISLIIYRFKILKKIPKISIMIPVYNGGLYLDRTITCILNQTFTDYEIVVVNDASKDNSWEILKKYAEIYSNIRIFNNTENRGILYTRAMLISNSTGEYLLFIDQDDFLEGHDNLEYLYKTYKDTKEDIIKFNTLYIKTKTIKAECNIYNTSLFQPQVYMLTFDKNKIRDYHIWNKLIKRELFLKVKEMLEDYIYGENWSYHEDSVWSILVRKYAKSMRCINKTVYMYQKHYRSLSLYDSNELSLKNCMYRQEIFQKIFDKNTEEILLQQINEFITGIKVRKIYFDIVRRKKDLKLRTINICRNFIERYENKTLNVIKIIRFLEFIEYY